MEREELEIVLKNHLNWLLENVEGWESMKAKLAGADLSHADLRYANLGHADLIKADLRRADLSHADLQGAGLRGADLRYADLRGADLRRADLRNAHLRGADLRNANLADADLQGAGLVNTILYNANLYNANLNGTKGVYIPLACPSHGSFIAWKKCRGYGTENRMVIVKLEIPEDAMRSSATGIICRASKAKVLDIQDLEGNSINSKAFSVYKDQQDFEYVVGEIVEPREPFCENRYDECASGIHFFVDREKAVRY